MLNAHKINPLCKKAVDFSQTLFLVDYENALFPITKLKK